MSKEYYAKNREKVLTRVKQYAADNPAQVRTRQQKWYQANREHVIDKAFRRVYGIPMAEKKRIIEQQEHRCACCGDNFEADQRTHLDHDHATGKIRGVLCGGCNTGLGHFRDSIPRLKNAVAYLELNSESSF